MNIPLSLLVLYIGIGVMLATRYVLRTEVRAEYNKTVLVVTWIVLVAIWFPAIVSTIVGASKKENK